MYNNVGVPLVSQKIFETDICIVLQKCWYDAQINDI